MQIYDKQQLAAMSDFEVNQELTAYVHRSDWLKHSELSADGKCFILHDAIGNPYFLDVIDYCNNWNDVMPLAHEHKIDINYVGTIAIAEHDCGVQYKNVKPQRAIVCCLILVLQAAARPG